jgi:L-threonylcarbamoyladenylate synthase
MTGEHGEDGEVIVGVGGAADEPDAEVVEQAVATLRAGRPLVLPTDTVYGLAALPTVEGATAALFALKGRGADTPVAVLCADADQALGLADPGAVVPQVRRIAERLWPGPLTLVLPRRSDLDYELGEPAATIGVRCPAHRLVQALAAAVGPLATTSANRHGEPTAATAPEVAAVFGPAVGLVLDGGPCASPPSAVVDATGGRWRVLREGRVDLAAITAAAEP